jgi:hypothetical protein
MLRWYSVCRNGQMLITSTDMLFVDPTNQGSMVKDGNTQLSKAREVGKLT